VTDAASRSRFPTQFSSGFRAIVISAVATIAVACSERVDPLPNLGADISEVGVSGLSSGAYMAGQYHVAHSNTVAGAGIVAGGPYGCAESVLGRLNPVWPVALAQNLNRAINGCTGTSMAMLGVPDAGRLEQRARERASGGEIDPVSGLKGDRVYLFAGKSDNTVAPSLVNAAAKLYEQLGVARKDIALVNTIDAGHGFVTQDKGESCSASRTPYVNDCDYDQAGALLAHIHGPLKKPVKEPAGKLLDFDQGAFSGDGLGDIGAVFVPDDCVSKPGCRVHVAFHGCDQNRTRVENAFVEGAGYNRWAAANRIIVLYPQTVRSASNPKACWDWWGYTGPNFLTRDASQIKAVHTMLSRLAEAPGS